MIPYYSAYMRSISAWKAFSIFFLFNFSASVTRPLEGIHGSEQMCIFFGISTLSSLSVKFVIIKTVNKKRIQTAGNFVLINLQVQFTKMLIKSALYWNALQHISEGWRQSRDKSKVKGQKLLWYLYKIVEFESIALRPPSYFYIIASHQFQ